MGHPKGGHFGGACAKSGPAGGGDRFEFSVWPWPSSSGPAQKRGGGTFFRIVEYTENLFFLWIAIVDNAGSPLLSLQVHTVIFVQNTTPRPFFFYPLYIFFLWKNQVHMLKKHVNILWKKSWSWLSFSQYVHDFVMLLFQQISEKIRLKKMYNVWKKKNTNTFRENQEYFLAYWRLFI